MHRPLLTFALAAAAHLAGAAPMPTPGVASPPARTAGEALCGPEIVLLGDAWEHVQLERDALRKLIETGDLVRVPQRTAALASHLVFMQNRSLMVFGEAREKLRHSVGEVLDAVPRWNAVALSEDRAPLAAELPRLDAWLQTVAAQFPEEALVTSSAASFLLPPVVPSLQIKLAEPIDFTPGRETTVRFLLVGPAGEAVVPEALHTTHTEKLHALVLDPPFRDYHHAHPQPTGVAGEYVFRFTPQYAGPYRLWLDAMPVATGRGEFPIADLPKIPRPIRKAPAPAAPVLASTVAGWNCQLTIPGGEFIFGQPNVATLTIADRTGEPVRRLQPLMGAFAHIVGFAEDLQTILHIHPLGPMPRAEDLGGPNIDFQLRPTQPGWLRLYVQFSIDGQTHLAAFAARVTVR